MGDAFDETDPDASVVLWAGAAAGAVATVWLAFGALLWRGEAWFPFSPGLLVDRLELAWLAVAWVVGRVVVVLKLVLAVLVLLAIVVVLAGAGRK